MREEEGTGMRETVPPRVHKGLPDKLSCDVLALSLTPRVLSSET